MTPEEESAIEKLQWSRADLARRTKLRCQIDRAGTQASMEPR